MVMRLPALVGRLFPLYVLVAAIAIIHNLPSTSAAAAQTLDEKISNLHMMTSKQGIMKFNSEKFDQYIRLRPRNYSVIVMTTALNPSRGCSVCGEAYEEYKILYNSYRSNNFKEFMENKVFFALVDYDEGAEVFQSLRLNSAPGFFHFPGSDKKPSKTQDKLELQKQGFQADVLAKWVADRTGIKINVMRPPSYAGLIIIVGIAGISLLLAYWTGFQFEWLKSKGLWAAISILIALTFTSGQMWNHIRGPPPMGRQGNGMKFIADSSQMQYVFETYWVWVMYAATSLGVIMLGDWAADETQQAGKRRTWGFIGIALFVVFYSLILATFRRKYQGYPYKLLF